MPTTAMKERTVLGSRTSFGLVYLLFEISKGKFEEKCAGELGGRDLPKTGETVKVITTESKGKEFTHVYW